MEKEITHTITHTGTRESDLFFSNKNLKTWLWIALFVFIAFTRFHNLGDKPFHHDESLYAKYIWNFHTGQGYKYDPMQHGPFMFHASQITLTLFGVSDYTIRILPALTGLALVWFLFYLRRRMPPGVALAAGWLFGINSVFMYFQRFLRHDPFFSLFAILSVFLALIWFSDRKAWNFYAFCASSSILYCIKENAFVQFLIMYLFVFLFVFVKMLKDKKKISDIFSKYPLAAKVMGAVTFWGISFVIYAGFNQFGKPVFENWDQAVHNYWIAIYAIFFMIVGYLVFLGESVRSKKDSRPFGIAPEFFRDSHIFAIGSVVFFAIMILLYTTFSKNPSGFWGAMYEWWTYWLHQHEIKRIAGPFDYYHHQMLIYAFLPVSVTLFALLGRAVRRNTMILAGYIVFAFVLYLGFSKVNGQLPVTDSVYFTNEHLALAIIAFVGGTLMTLSYLWQNASFKAFLVWWSMFAYVTYSYLQEKVPWLTMHIITPMIIFAAIVLVEFFRDRERTYPWLRGTVKVLLSIMVVYALHTSFQLCFFHAADPVEQMVYVQTTYEIPMLVKEMEDIAKWNGTYQKKELPIIINGHATWPLYWYLRDWTGISYGNNVNPSSHLMVICNWEDRHKFAAKCGDKYVARKYGLRAWFLPKYRDVAKGGKFWRNAWRWVMYREQFDKNLYGAQMICVFTRKDVSKFDKSVDLGEPAEAPKHREPPNRTKINIRSEKQFGSFGSQNSKFNTPKDLAVDKNGNIFVVDQNNNRIQKFDSNGKYILQWGSEGDTEGKFNKPTGICVDAQGKVYVTDTWNHRIQVFDNDGKVKRTCGNNKVCWAPKDIVVDDSGYLYIANTGFHSIKKCTRSGTEIWNIGSKGAGAIQFTEPVGLALDKTGRLYVADTANKRISVFDKDGHHVKQINVFGLEEYYSEPYITIDNVHKVLYMTDSRNHDIQVFSLNGNFKSFWGKEGSGAGEFKQPIGVEYANGKVYVSEAQNHRIQIFDANMLAK